MDFGTAINTCLKKYAEVQGRAGRQECWYFLLFGFLVHLAAGVLDNAFRLGAFSALVGLALIVPQVTVIVRRLHDMNRSGWWALLLLFPFVGWIVLAVLLAQPGAAGDNAYGPPP